MIDRNLKLFKCEENEWVTYGEFVNALKKVVDTKCEVLFVHTSMNFGVPNRELKRKELMDAMYSAIEELGIKTLVFPTFTFSFCNEQDYDVKTSGSKMGMLNEYARKREDAVRSMDPLLSVCVIGENKDLAIAPERFSIGDDSIFDKLHKTPNVYFLFLGMPFPNCFTYMHYVEERLHVPYRYNKVFSGKIIDENGEVKAVDYELFVRYKGVIPVVPSELDDNLMANGFIKKVKLGNGIVSCIEERGAYAEIEKIINDDIFSFSQEHYEDVSVLEKEYQYGNVISL